MAKSDEPITIKKYANRRLYNTGTSTYVTLEDLASMVKAGEDFVVFDAKTNEDITRSVLTQIIFEQENKEGGQIGESAIESADRRARCAYDYNVILHGNLLFGTERRPRPRTVAAILDSPFPDCQ